VKRLLPTFLFQLCSFLIFGLFASMLHVSAAATAVLSNFLWVFFAIHTFFVEPIVSGIWIYLRMEQRRTYSQWWPGLWLIISLWSLILVLSTLLFIDTAWLRGSALAALMLNSLGVNALLLVVGPILGQDRRSPWIGSFLLLPFLLPLALSFSMVFDGSGSAAVLRLLLAVVLVYATISFYTFPRAAMSVED
jgi:hypothetical protein